MSLQALGASLIMVLFAAGAGVLYSLAPSIRNDNAIAEVVMLSEALSEAEFYMKDYGGFREVVQGGYIDAGSYPKDKNIFGQAVKATSETASVFFEYTTNKESQCNYLASRIPKLIPNIQKNRDPKCDNRTLSFALTAQR
jgi:hypothetical protein